MFFAFRRLKLYGTTYGRKHLSYIPLQNGGLERKHHYTLKIERFMCCPMKSPENWENSYLTSMHPINQMPSSFFGHEFFLQRLFQKYPYYSISCLFGRTYFIFLPKNERLKLASKSSIFVCFLDMT